MLTQLRAREKGWLGSAASFSPAPQDRWVGPAASFPSARQRYTLCRLGSHSSSGTASLSTAMGPRGVSGKGLLGPWGTALASCHHLA